MAEVKPEIKSADIIPEPPTKNQVKSTVVCIAVVAVIVFLGLGTVACACNNSPAKIPSTFDPSAIKSTIGANNSVQMTFAEYEKISQSAWNEQSRTMAISTPAIFRDNRIPALHIEKKQDLAAPDLLDTMVIDGLEQGDILFSPIDGNVEVEKGPTMLMNFFIRSKDSRGRDIVIFFSTTGLNSLLDLDHPIGVTSDNRYNLYEIKKGDLIGSLLTSDKLRSYDGQILIKGNAPFLENFNLATTSDSKLIEIIK